jgi:hypothetical protein
MGAAVCTGHACRQVGHPSVSQLAWSGNSHDSRRGWPAERTIRDARLFRAAAGPHAPVCVVERRRAKRGGSAARFVRDAGPCASRPTPRPPPRSSRQPPLRRALFRSPPRAKPEWRRALSGSARTRAPPSSAWVVAHRQPSAQAAGTDPRSCWVHPLRHRIRGRAIPLGPGHVASRLSRWQRVLRPAAQQRRDRIGGRLGAGVEMNPASADRTRPRDSC